MKLTALLVGLLVSGRADAEVVGYVNLSTKAYSAIVCEVELETCGVRGFTEEGVPVLLISKTAVEYFAPYGLLTWELSPVLMTRVWDKIAGYPLRVEWVWENPNQASFVDSDKDRKEQAEGQRAWIARVSAPLKNTPENWIRLPPKLEDVAARAAEATRKEAAAMK